MKRFKVNTMRKTTKNNLFTFGGTTLLCVVFAVLLQNGVLNSMTSGMLIPIGIYVIMAISLNLTVGILGELSLGHAGFMCVGAFSSATVSQIFLNSGMPVWLAFTLAIVFGAVCAAIMGVLIGIPVMRLRGDYLAIVTLGFGEIMKSLFNNIYIISDKNGLHFGFTTPPENIDAQTKTEILSGPKGTSAPALTNFWIVAAVLLVCLFILMMFIDSKSGRACQAVRDNYIAAQSVGINVTKFRLMAFTISAAIAGAAGALYAHSLANMLPKKFDYNLSILILVYVVLGGLGSLRGSVIATIVLYALPEMLRGINQDIVQYRMLIYSIILIFIMLWKNAPVFIRLRERIATSDFVKRLRSKFNKKGNSADLTSGGAEL